MPIRRRVLVIAAVAAGLCVGPAAAQSLPAEDIDDATTLADDA